MLLDYKLSILHVHETTAIYMTIEEGIAIVNFANTTTQVTQAYKRTKLSSSYNTTVSLRYVYTLLLPQYSFLFVVHLAATEIVFANHGQKQPPYTFIYDGNLCSCKHLYLSILRYRLEMKILDTSMVRRTDFDIK